MNEGSAAGQLEIGRYITQVREDAGIKQIELAKRITMSPAVLSRVETGERAVASDELQIILHAIGTPKAKQLSDLLERSWTVLPRPPLDHPDQDVLWEAEKIAKELSALREQPDVRRAFARRLDEYISEMQHVANLLLKREHQVAFIGSIGIGKSTAICRLAKLEIPAQDGGPAVPVLEAGAGGITVCEVHLQSGPNYGLRIEPRSDEEIRADVTDFAEHILKESVTNAEDNAGEEVDSQGISKEIERALRNMSGLKVRREKDTSGKTIRHDEAKELGKKLSSVRELVVEVLAKMELHQRDRRDVWYDSSINKPPLVWLKETFEQVNNGRHSDFSLPKRIEVIVPYDLLEGSNLSVRLLDTKGIDRTAARADLEDHLDEPHTLAILCSEFNAAPGANSHLLLERAKDAGVRNLDLNASILVLPRTNEALAVKDESGIRVETVEEGYELKGEQAEMALEPLGYQFSVGFFNAYQDDPRRLRDFLIERLTAVRQSFRGRLQEISSNANNLLQNHQHAQTEEVIRQAAAMLRSWISQNTTVPTLRVHIQDSLMNQMSTVYASTIRATVRREGEWQNLSYSHHLGYGARRMAALSLTRTVEGFIELCKTLVGNPDYTEAQDLIRQAERVLQSSFEDLLRKVQLMGQTCFHDELKIDAAFWSSCSNEWGRGPGYRDRVTQRNDAWFKESSRQDLEKELRLLIEKEWSHALSRVAALFESEETI